MGDDKASPSSSARPIVGSDRELLMQAHNDDVEDPPKAGPSPPSAYHSGREVLVSLSHSLSLSGLLTVDVRMTKEGVSLGFKSC